MKDLIKNFFERFVFFTKLKPIKINLFRYDVGKKSKHETRLRKEKFRKGEITTVAILTILYFVTVVSCILEANK